MTDPDLTPEQIRDRAEWCRNTARQGADQLHARAATPERQPKLTNAESAAIARAKLDRQGKS